MSIIVQAGLSPGLLRKSSITVAFDGAAGNGAVGTVALFTVTGRVYVELFSAFCSETLAGATATVEAGATGATQAFLATTTATAIVADDWWGAATVTQPGSITAVPATTASSPALRGKLVSADLILTIATANVTDGTLVIDVFWYPVSADGNLA